MKQNLSRHATLRCKQRGIPMELLENIDRFGEVIRSSHGADRVRLPKRTIGQVISVLKQAIHDIEKTNKLEVILGQETNKIITAYFV